MNTKRTIGHREFLEAAAIASTLVVAIAAATDVTVQPPAERTRFLLLDSRIIESKENVTLTVGLVHKDPRNPLFKEDKPWEPRFNNLYANVIYDNEDNLYKCWYSPFIVDLSAKGMTLQQRRETRYRPPRSREMGICYAVSRDGLKWEKPELGLVEFEGSTQNGCCKKQADLRQCHRGKGGMGRGF